MSNTTIVTQWVTKKLTRDCLKHKTMPRTPQIIYSYGKHHPMAKHVNIDGVDSILLSATYYSVTTQRHSSIVKRVAYWEGIPVHVIHTSVWDKCTSTSELQAAKQFTESYVNQLRKKKEDSKKEEAKVRVKWKSDYMKKAAFANLGIPEDVLEKIYKYDSRTVKIGNMIEAMNQSYWHRNLRAIGMTNHSTFYKTHEVTGNYLRPILDMIISTSPEVLVSEKRFRDAIKIHLALLA